MLGLKALNKRQKLPESGKTETSVGAQMRRNRIEPLKRVYLGRQLGFSFDGDGIQMAAASHRGKQVQLLDVRRAQIPEDLTDDDSQRTFIAEAVADYARQFGTRNSTVTLVVGGKNTAFRSLTMPYLKRQQLRSAVELEAKRQFPFPASESIKDFRPIERIKLGDSDRVRISLVGAVRNHVENQLSLLTPLGVDVDYVYHRYDAIGQLLRSLPDYSPDTPVAIADIRHDRTNVAFFQGSNLVFIHTSPVGSSYLVNRADPTTLDYFAESLSTEIQNSLDYYTGQFSSSIGSKVYLCGSIPSIEELATRLSKGLDVSFLRFPVEQLKFAEHLRGDFRPSLENCLPAVAAAVSRSRLANLLPAQTRQHNKQRAWQKRLVAGLALLAVTLGAHWYMSLTQLGLKQQQLAQLQEEIQTFQTSDVYQTYTLLRHQIARDQAYVAKAQSEPSHVSVSLKELTHLTPDDIRLYQLNYTPELAGANLLLGGAIETTTPPEVILAEFVENLTSSPLYTNVELLREVKQLTAEGYRLDFQIGLRGSAQ